MSSTCDMTIVLSGRNVHHMQGDWQQCLHQVSLAISTNNPLSETLPICARYCLLRCLYQQVLIVCLLADISNELVSLTRVVCGKDRETALIHTKIARGLCQVLKLYETGAAPSTGEETIRKMVEDGNYQGSTLSTSKISCQPVILHRRHRYEGVTKYHLSVCRAVAGGFTLSQFGSNLRLYFCL